MPSESMPPSSDSALFLFPDLVLHFFRPLGVERLFVGGELTEQSQKLASVNTLLVGDVFEYFDGELVEDLS